ncbi:MAG: glutamate formimidoyltransferase [Armatimonadetes bacterium]|nr:glutamate formimidoyltransferase [Armatimonadota bacterium]
MLPLFLQCVPNVSEGRDPEAIQALADSVRSVSGVHLVDFSSDPDHHRSVFTLLGEPAGLESAILQLFDCASRTIDIRSHVGEHPRVGAVDVVPFVPLLDTPMETAVALADRVAREVGRLHRLPVFLYEESATRPDRRRLPDLRRGQLKGLETRMAQEGGGPDYGPAEIHPRLGATIIGARRPLVAYNILLDTGDVQVAKAIARILREQDGGLRTVRAIGVMLGQQGRAQVSINLTDPAQVSMYRVLEMVRTEARRYGVTVLSSQLVGLTPLGALVETASYYLQLPDLNLEQVLEYQLLRTLVPLREGSS